MINLPHGHSHIAQRSHRLPVLEENFIECLPDHLLFGQVAHFFHAGSRLFGTRILHNFFASNGLQRLRVLDRLGATHQRSPFLRTSVKFFPKRVAIECERHGVLSLITRGPEHDTLVASTDVKIILADVHTICNARALLIDAEEYLAVLVIQSLAVNAATSVKESNPTFCTTPGIGVYFPSNSDLSCGIHSWCALHTGCSFLRK